MKAPVRHIHHPQTIVATTVNRFGHHHDLIEGHRHRALVSKQNHSSGVRYTKNIYSKPICDHRTAVIVDRHLHDLFALARLTPQLIERDLSPGLIVSHCLSP